jgi:hypothetical protein
LGSARAAATANESETVNQSGLTETNGDDVDDFGDSGAEASIQVKTSAVETCISTWTTVTLVVW